MTDPSSQARIATLRRRWEEDKSSRIFLQLAEELRRVGQLDEAIETLQAGIAAHPGYVSAQVSLGRCLFERGDFAAAASILQRVIAQDPTQLVATKLLIQALLGLDRPEPAAELLDLYGLLNSSDPDVPGLRTRLRAMSAAQLREAAFVEPAIEVAAEDSSDAYPATRIEPIPVAAWDEIGTVDEVDPSAGDASAAPESLEATAPLRTIRPALAVAELQPAAGEVFALPRVVPPAPVLGAIRPPVRPRIAAVLADPFPGLGAAVAVAADRGRGIFTLTPRVAAAAAAEAPAPPAPSVATAAMPVAPAPVFDEAVAAVPDWSAPAAVDEVTVEDFAAPAPAPVPVAEEEPWETTAAEPAALESGEPMLLEPQLAWAPIEPAALAEVPGEALIGVDEEGDVAASWSSPESQATPAMSEPEAFEVPATEVFEDPVFEAPSAAAFEPVSQPVFEPVSAPAFEPALESTLEPTFEAPRELPSFEAPSFELEAAADLDDTEPAALTAPTAFEVPPEAPEVTATLGELYLRQGHLAEAEAIFRAVLERQPDSAVASAGLARVVEKRQRPVAASELLDGFRGPAGLSAKKSYVLQRYLSRLRQGA